MILIIKHLVLSVNQILFVKPLNGQNVFQWTL